MELYSGLAMHQQVYLSTMLHTITANLAQDSQNIVDAQRIRELWINCAAVVIFTGMIVLHFAGSAEKLAERISAARAMLMLLPDGVIFQIAPLYAGIRDIGQELAAAHQQDGSSPSHASWKMPILRRFPSSRIG